MVARQAFCLEHICRHRSSLHPWNAADDWLDRETTARYHEAIDQRLSQLLYGGDIATSWENGERAVALANLASGYLMVALYQSGQQSEGPADVPASARASRRRVRDGAKPVTPRARGSDP